MSRLGGHGETQQHAFPEDLRDVKNASYQLNDKSSHCHDILVNILFQKN